MRCKSIITSVLYDKSPDTSGETYVGGSPDEGGQGKCRTYLAAFTSKLGLMLYSRSGSSLTRRSFR